MIGGLSIAAAPRRRIYREAIKGGELIITFEELPRKAPTKQEPSAEGPVHQASAEPSSPLASWDIRLVAADIADALAGQPLGGPIWQSTWLRVHAEAEGRVSLDGRGIPVEVDQDLRRKLVGPNALDDILGYASADGKQFVIGAAGLTEPERDAVNFWLSPPSDEELSYRRPLDSEDLWHRTAREVRDLMDRRRGRRRMPLAIETVENYLSRARAKLRALAAN